MGHAMYMQTVPNSHSFGSLRNILVSYNYHRHELTKDYLLIGFNNTLKRETQIRIVKDANEEFDCTAPVFVSVEKIIEYLNSKKELNLEELVSIVNNTLNGGHDLKCARKMERRDVYKCVDTERDYQDLRWSPRREKNGTPDEQKPPAEWINYMEYHLSAAKNEVYFLNDEAALAQIRKVAALAVRCLELHGCPEREIPKELLNQK